MTLERIYKRTAVVGLSLLLLLYSANPALSQALSTEEIPQIFGITLGVETGITSRDVLEEDLSTPGVNFRGDAVSTRFLGRIGFRFFDRIEIYGKGGGADLSISEFNDYDARLAPAYGGGLRLDLYKGPFPDRIKIFVDGSFLFFVTEDTIQILDCPTLLRTPPGKCQSESDQEFRTADEKIRWREGTILAGGSFRHDYFEPYGGVRLSLVRAEDKLDLKTDSNFLAPESIAVDLDEDNNLGIFFGTNIYLDRSERSAISLEFSAIDQFAFMAGFKVGF